MARSADATWDRHTSEARFALEAIRSGATGDDVETETLDCKVDPTTRSANGTVRPGSARSDGAARLIAECAACLSNHDGGAVLLGIADDRSGVDAFSGTALDAAWLRSRIRELTLPPLTVAVDELHEPEGRLLLVRVGRNAGSEPHSAVVSKSGGRRTPRRVGTGCHDMTTLAELLGWSQERSGYDWSAAPSGRPAASARPAAIEAIRDLLRSSGEPDRQRIAELHDVDLLRRLQLLRPDDTLSRAGELLVCPAPSPRLLYLDRHAAGAPAQRRIEQAGLGLAEELARISDAIDRAVSRHSLPSSALVVGVAEALPVRAVREAIVNAIMHRDWDVPEPIVIEQTGDELIVFSPGGLFGGVRLETLLTAQSRTRNRLLGDALRSLRLAEREGTGIDRMYIELVRLGHAPPTFEERDGGIRAALVGGPPIAAVVAVHDGMSERLRGDARATIVLHLLRSMPSLTIADIADIAGEGDGELRAFLRLAESDGLLTRTANPRPGGIPAWRLSDDVRATLGSILSYFSRPTSESVLLVGRLARDQGIVRNRDVQDLLGVTQPRASQILARAADEGLIELAPGARPTGRGTAYVPNGGTSHTDASTR